MEVVNLARMMAEYARYEVDSEIGRRECVEDQKIILKSVSRFSGEILRELLQKVACLK